MAWRGVSSQGTHPELVERISALLDDPELGGLVEVLSATRSIEKQAWLYGCYLRCRPDCGGQCNLAAPPGQSNHNPRRDGYGHAVDLSWKKIPRTTDWQRLERVARKYGLVRTVPSEWWHYEMAADRVALPNAGIPPWEGMFVPVLVAG